ncbi:budded virus envelope fusion protein EFP [Pieris rapae granulovirus Wuhan]|uniref:Budded virus envelope fusion protein EFP n=1 Tax=Pieris rapae granulovirus Wuhan TaxID=2848030 RepID=D2J4J3_9BBAC|nr:budded virus envelope fusion protein EFP [Betabaculovirus arrapae]ACZ63512.1 budded virus envelope fusion protein EFP [Betabaculovirus arrapae]UOS85700.1 efp [Pieris rapae granulovirus]
MLTFPSLITTDETVQLTPINQTGFHYEFQSNLGFVVNTWSFILNVEYTILKDRLLQLQNVSKTIQMAFNKGGVLSNCTWNEMNGNSYKREIDYVINRKIANLFDTHNNIEYLLIHKRLPKKNRRTKRGFLGGAFNFMGRFYKYTMGVMDDKDAALLYEIANHTNNTDYRVKTLTNETLHIAECLQSIRHKFENEVNCHYLERQLVYLKDNLEEIEKTYNKLIIGIQSALYNARISSLIINPQILLAEMTAVDSNLWDKETEWVVKPQFDQMHTVMRLAQCNVFINPRDELMFVIQIPRMDKSTFFLYKPVSIPECDVNKMCKFLVPQSRYIGFEARTTPKHYVRLDDTSVCTLIDNMTLCYGSITSKKIEYSPDCDVRLFNGLERNNCQVHATQFHNEIFYSLNNVNKWLYMVNEKPIHAEMNCGSGRYDKKLVLQGMGIITIMKYCKLRTSRTILISKHISNYEQDNFTVVYFNFSQFVLPSDYINNGKIVKSLDFDTLKDVTFNLKHLVTQEQADSVLSIFNVDNNSNANWYSNLFGNWWWEFKFILYAVCIIIITLITLNIKKVFCGSENCVSSKRIVLPMLSPKL